MLIRIRPKMDPSLSFDDDDDDGMMCWILLFKYFLLVHVVHDATSFTFWFTFAALEIIIAVSSTGSFRPGRDESCNVGARR